MVHFETLDNFRTFPRCSGGPSGFTLATLRLRVKAINMLNLITERYEN
jgi:hypothetical protein